MSHLRWGTVLEPERLRFAHCVGAKCDLDFPDLVYYQSYASIYDYFDSWKPGERVGRYLGPDDGGIGLVYETPIGTIAKLRKGTRYIITMRKMD